MTTSSSAYTTSISRRFFFSGDTIGVALGLVRLDPIMLLRLPELARELALDEFRESYTLLLVDL